jgi:hypothetical protein
LPRPNSFMILWQSHNSWYLMHIETIKYLWILYVVRKKFMTYPSHYPSHTPVIVCAAVCLPFPKYMYSQLCCKVCKSLYQSIYVSLDYIA